MGQPVFSVRAEQYTTSAGTECTLRRLGLAGRRAYQDAVKDESGERAAAVLIAHGCTKYGDVEVRPGMVDEIWRDMDLDEAPEIAMRVLRISGLLPDAVEDAAKNSESAQSLDSVSA